MKASTRFSVIVALALSAASFNSLADSRAAGPKAERAPAAAAAARPGEMCRMFDSAMWDNMGFMVPCRGSAATTAAVPARCPMFDPPAWDNAGFTVSCTGDRRDDHAGPRSCPMFDNATWDNMGFRVPC